ncbi:TransThyretin-Related family domain [Caenorhabditis elegans]|uniref:TransThyretin-Related family domain n=1 Tax=Caenorhabditis elegans TaxID=6239 RepID=Q9TZ95_CAEEL|nr:TransThyretin-Related family domain [Caenorhabditis elegans]CCD68641.1 TransThyretin-Related family domain [Caenorhabditis elegans]|eukprot:NP_497563.2 Uncharacterized protein CELE_E02H9.9 [Caenorhabditis elegans]
MVSQHLLLTFIFLIPAVLGTRFHFSGNLICPLPVFNYRVEMHEEDTFKEVDDKIGETDWMVSRRPNTYDVIGNDTDDGADILQEFEIYMLIIHDCNPSRNVKSLKVDWGTYNIYLATVDKTMDVQIYDRGTHI